MLKLLDMTIRQKLTLVIMLTCAAALVSAATAFVIYEHINIRHDTVASLLTQAEMIAHNCKAVSAFEDVKDAKETLNSLHMQPSIVYGCIYNSNGELLASYHRSGNGTDRSIHPPLPQKDGYQFDNEYLIVYKSVVFDGGKIGTVCLQSNLRPMYKTFQRSASIIIVVLALSSLVAYFVSSRLQRIISGPILSLTHAAEAISKKAASGKNTHSIRAQKHSNDEVGLLADSFNQMLEQIQQRELALVAANEELEARVQRRTSELRTTNEQLTKENTERKQAEENLKLAYEKLENANRELKEMQSQLVQNEKLASMGQLAAGVAHEMNTPVGFVASNFEALENYVKKFKDLLRMYDSLIGKIGTLRKTELLNEADTIGQSRNEMQIDFILKDIQGLFDDSREGLDRVTNIIQSLRDFSRVDQVEEFDEYNLNDGIKATLVVARNEIKYDTDVKTELSDVPTVFCNSMQINQVLLNIIVNAAHAIKSQKREDRGTITIKTYATDEEMVCEISDDGPGVAPDKLSKVFDPFFTTKPLGKGTGLGLSVSHDIIVTKHRGELLVDSTVGKGTKFTIKLPIKRKCADYEQEIENNGKENSIICGR